MTNDELRDDGEDGMTTETASAAELVRLRLVNQQLHEEIHHLRQTLRVLRGVIALSEDVIVEPGI